MSKLKSSAGQTDSRANAERKWVCLCRGGKNRKQSLDIELRWDGF